MAEIVLTTLNARFLHAAFGLRYLLANLGDLKARAEIVEFDINQKPLDIVSALLERQPRLVGFGVYIWNARETTEVVATLKRVRPDIVVVLGGPEVSYETEQQDVARLADCVITGEADLMFAEVCRGLLSPAAHKGAGFGAPASSTAGGVETIRGAVPEAGAPLLKIIPAEPPDVNRLALPYDLYTDRDIARRVIYVEASRGCPFTCEFCLSSLDIPVRQFALEPFLAAMQRLLDRGVRRFKFVDRTFNLNLKTSAAILRFFLERHTPGLFVHFEMVPDRLPAELREIIRLFPPGALQFEVGIQTFNPEVGRLISRRQNYERLADNLRWLRAKTGVHVHADLIVGLPGESLESFASGFDRLVALGPQEIQVGILKRLRGTPIVRHDAEWGMVYDPHPPYEILQTKLMDFATMHRMRHFASYWDRVANSGNFVETTPRLWHGGQSPFWSFLKFSDWLYAESGRHHGIALTRLCEMLFRYLTVELRQDAAALAPVMLGDYQRGGRDDVPSCLRPHLPAAAPVRRTTHADAPARQARHLAQARAV